MHAGAPHAVADDEVILAIIDDRRTGAVATGLTFFRSVPGVPKPLSDRKRAAWRMPSSPTRDVNPECRQAGVSESESRPTGSKTGLIYSGKVPK